MYSIAVMMGMMGIRSGFRSLSRVSLILLMMLGVGIDSIWSQEMPAPPETGHAKILVLGTFHFDDQGLDGYKPKHRLDFLSEARQREVGEVLDALARFRPTKIAVEWRVERQAALDSEFAKYRAGSEAAVGPNEIYQIGFRLARRLGHSRIYAIDAPDKPFGPAPSTEALIRRAHSLGQAELVERGTKWAQWYEDLDIWEDALKTRQTLLEHLRYLNSPQHTRQNLGRYLVAQFEVGGGGDYTGADWRTGWYNRNLRIFSNLERVRTANSDRILVIIGSGHIPILLHLAENAPEFEPISASSVLEAR